MKINTIAEVEISDLVEALTGQLSKEDLCHLVTEIDACVADWDFTRNMADYFNREIDKEGHARDN